MDPYLYSVSELQEFLESRGLEIKGTKTALIDRLIDNDPQCFQRLPPPAKVNTHTCKSSQLSLENRRKVTEPKADKSGAAVTARVKPSASSIRRSVLYNPFWNLQKDENKREPLRPLDRNEPRCKMNNSHNFRHHYNES